MLIPKLYAIDLKVLAIEHHPYTSTKLKCKGLSFEILNKVFRDSEFKVIPVIVPSRRAKYPVSLFSFPENDSIMQTEKKYLVIKGGPWFNLNLPETDKVMNYYIYRIKEMKQDGSLLKIFERYYGVGKVPSGVIID